MIEPGMRFVAAAGGIGGLGNASLASPEAQGPRLRAARHARREGDVVLELKTVADIALVGFPSAGKSSLIAAISAARPKIADYPFTTLHPNLGVVQSGDIRFTIADVPGLIEGASEGKGLGLEFLRHVERCTALVHVLDCATLDPGRDPLSDLDVILAELAAYPVPEGQTPLLERPQLIALNKIDVPEARTSPRWCVPELEARGYRVFEISTVEPQGPARADVRARPGSSRSTARRWPRRPRPRGSSSAPAAREKEFTVRVEGGTYGTIYRVLGEKPVRWVQQTDFTNDEAVGYLADRLEQAGRRERAVQRAPRRLDGRHRRGRRRHLRLGAHGHLGGGADAAPRGTDPRLYEGGRRTTTQRRET